MLRLETQACRSVIVRSLKERAKPAAFPQDNLLVTGIYMIAMFVGYRV